MVTALFAWELGSGLGHLVRMRRLAACLSRHDVRVIAAVKDPTAAQILQEHVAEIVPARPWPWPAGIAHDHGRGAVSSVSMADTLADLGLADQNVLRGLLLAWDELFALYKPDIIVGDYAPTAALAARGRLPLILVGNGFTLPPADIATFPVLHTAAPAKWSEDRVLGGVNDALKSANGSAPLARLPQLFAADYRAVQSFPLLDPYRFCRTEPLDGPLFDAHPLPRSPTAQSIVAYLRGHEKLRAEAFEAVFPFASRLHIYGSGISADQAAALARYGASISPAPLSMRSTLATARLLIHLGGAGVAAEAIAAGVPQLVLSVDIEKDLYGDAIEEAGIGRLIKMHDPAAAISRDMIASMFEDDMLAYRAAAAGDLHRTLLLRSDPLSRFESAFLRLTT